MLPFICFRAKRREAPTGFPDYLCRLEHGLDVSNLYLLNIRFPAIEPFLPADTSADYLPRTSIETD